MVNLVSMLNDNGIYPSETFPVINGDNCLILPVVLSKQLCYFKFFDYNNIDRVKLEVNFVNYLFENNVKVNRIIFINNDCLFYSSGYIFFGTYNVGQMMVSKQIGNHMIFTALQSIADMHSKSLTFNDDNAKYLLQSESDFERLKIFCEQNKEFLSKCKLLKIVNQVLQFETDRTEPIIIHSDLNFKNISSNGVIIDFSDLKIGGIEDDLGKFFQNLLYLENFKTDDLKKYIEFYEKQSKNSVSLNNVIISCFYRIVYRMSCHFSESGFDEKYLQRSLEILNNLLQLGEKIQYDKRSGL